MVGAASLVSAAVIVVRLLGPAPAITSDVMALVPQDERDPVLAAAIERSTRLVASRVAFLIRGEPEARLEAARADLQEALERTGLFVPLETEVEAHGAWLFRHRDRLLCPKDRTLLERARGHVVAREALARLYSPLVPVPGDLVRADPLLLTLRLVDCFSPTRPPARDEALIAGRLTASPFATDVQDRIAATLLAWRALQADQSLELNRAGAVFHAAEGAASARAEIARVSAVSIAVVILVFLSLFARLRAALLAVSAMAIGVLGGLAACLALFSSVHVLALVFGAAISGVAVDYAIHVMVARRAASGHPAGPSRLGGRSVAKPLRIGLVTTLAGFACLLVPDVALLRQIAVFGCAGLLLSYGFSRFVLDRLAGHPGPSPASAAVLATSAHALLAWRPRAAVLVPAGTVVALLAWSGAQRITPADQVRSFQAPPAGLIREEDAVASVAGQQVDSRFLLVRAPGLEVLHAREAKALEGLERPLPSPAWLDPGPKRQAETRQLIERRLFEPELAQIADRLGIDASRTYQDQGGEPPGDVPLAALRGEAAGTRFSVVPLEREDADTLQNVPLPSGTALIDPADVYSDLLGRLRREASFALALALGASGLGLVAICRSIGALRLLLPAGIAIVLAPVAAGLLGTSVSLFSVMGLFLALGLGIDYAAFLAVDRPAAGAPGEDGWREAGILAAAVTTIVPVSLLAWSDTLPVAHFGFAVALGTALCLVLAPLARGQAAASRTRVP